MGPGDLQRLPSFRTQKVLFIASEVVTHRDPLGRECRVSPEHPYHAALGCPVGLASPDLDVVQGACLELDGEPARCEDVSPARADRDFLRAVDAAVFPGEVPFALVGSFTIRVVLDMRPVPYHDRSRLREHRFPAFGTDCPARPVFQSALALPVNERVQRHRSTVTRTYDMHFDPTDPRTRRDVNRQS